jgi:hypothetical protein
MPCVKWSGHTWTGQQEHEYSPTSPCECNGFPELEVLDSCLLDVHVHNIRNMATFTQTSGCASETFSKEAPISSRAFTSNFGGGGLVYDGKWDKLVSNIHTQYQYYSAALLSSSSFNCICIVFVVCSVSFIVCSFVCCVLFECNVSFCVMCVICVLCLIVVVIATG